MFSDSFRFFWPPTVTCTMCDFAEKYPKTSQKWVQNESKMRILSQKYSFFIIFLEFVDESANRCTAPYTLPMTSIWVPMMIWGELECFQIFQIFWTSTLYRKKWNYDPQNTLKMITFWAQIRGYFLGSFVGQNAIFWDTRSGPKKSEKYENTQTHPKSS